MVFIFSCSRESPESHEAFEPTDGSWQRFDQSQLLRVQVFQAQPV